jgi:uncharacterized protein involved in exopolysaccharide biosynthesis
MKRHILILLKGLPVILGCFFLALFVARKMVSYTPNTYQSIARIKLDDQKYGFSNNVLYQDFDVFSAENKIESEAEVLKSPLLVGKALDSLGSFVRIARIGQMKNTELYDDSPIAVTSTLTDPKMLDRAWRLDIAADSSFTFGPGEGEEGPVSKGRLGEPLLIGNEVITVSAQDALIQARGLELFGPYAIILHSRDGLIASVSERLDVTAVDKEVAVLRVVYKDQNAQRTADLANALCEAYMDDYVNTRSAAANQTVRFIDEKLKKVGEDLTNAEARLEQYKRDNRVVNTLQETETGLRQLSSLEVQRINLEMNAKAVNELEAYIAEGDYFDGAAINFGFGDLLLTELAKRLKQLRDESHDAKIAEVIRYIKEAIARNKSEVMTKQEELDKALAEASTRFDGLPKRERDMQVLDREFQLQKQVYEFLSQKRIEASIASSALISFHRVLQPATVAKEPVSPNRTLITFVAGLLGLVGGMALVLIWNASSGKVSAREEIEQRSAVPVCGVVRKDAPESDFDTLVKSLLVKGELRSGHVVAVASTLCDEGRTHLSQGLAEALVRAGLPVTLVHQVLAPHTDRTTMVNGYTDVVRRVREGRSDVAHIEALRTADGIVLVDALPTAMSVDGVQAMKAADLSLFVVRAGRTQLTALVQPDLLMAEYGLANLRIVLNDAHRATSYSGTFIGTRYQHGTRAGGVVQRAKQYITAYLG